MLVDILTIGNEILLGLIEDTNSSYLCRVVRGMNCKVRHISIVPDAIEAIAADLKRSLASDVQLIFTCGGLGPTDDDMTLAGIASAVSRKLTVDPTARQLVERRYRELASSGYVSHSEMSVTRLKMANLPEGAHAVENPVGAAPAVVIKVDKTHIVSLPGVPAELRAIVEGPLQDFLTGLFGRGSYREREITVGSGDESELAMVLREVSRLHPDVYIKSRASHFGDDVRFRIVICVSAASAEEADRTIETVLTDLTSSLQKAGISQ